jgi:chaperonin GroES
MNVKPLADRVVVKPLEEQEVNRGGIIIPDTAKEKPMQGEIMEVGSGRVTDDGKTMPLEVKKGDRVLYGKYSGTEVSIDGEEYLIMRESDIFAVIRQS